MCAGVDLLCSEALPGKGRIRKGRMGKGRMGWGWWYTQRDRLRAWVCGAPPTMQACAGDVLKGALSGYNGTILCFGQTGGQPEITASMRVSSCRKERCHA